MGKRIEHRIVNNVTQKRCSHCHTWKSLEQFSNNRNIWDGKSAQCKQCYSAYDKKRNKENRDMISAYNKDYNEDCREEISVYNKKYSKEHLEVHRRANARRRSHTKKFEAIKTSEWLETLKLFDNKCAYCGSNHTKLISEHVVPLSKDGKDTIDNLVPACESCNGHKYNHDMSTWYKEQAFFTSARMERIESIIGLLKEGGLSAIS